MASLSIAKAEPGGFVRAGIRLFLIGMCFLGVPFHVLWLVARVRSPWPVWFLRTVGWICGARVKRYGKPLTRDVFYVANHLSWIDIPILGGMVDTRFVAQEPIAEWPLLGWLAKLNATLFVSRTDLLSVDAQIDALRRSLDHQRPMTLFPEGTTTDGRSLLPFKRSLFEAIAPAPRPLMVQPVLLDFGRAGPDIAWIGVETFGENAKRLLFRGGSYRVGVRFLEPFDPVPFGNRKAIAAEARGRIAAALSASLGGAVIV